MTKFKINRRSVLKGAGTGLVALSAPTIFSKGAWAQDFWTMCDEWGGRVLLLAAVLAAVAGPIAAWFRLDRRVAGVEDRQKLTDEKLNYLRDRVDGIQEALDGKLNRILELLARYFEDKH